MDRDCENNLVTTEQFIDTAADEDKLRSIIMALSSDISDLYTVDVATRSVYAYRMSGNAKGVKLGLQAQLTYDALMETYISMNVHVDDCEDMREAVVFESICEQLKEHDKFIYHYRVGGDDDTHYYYLKCAAAGTKSDFDTVIFAFVGEDDDVITRKMIRSIEIDELTGLYTRQAFYHKAKQLIDANPDKSFDLAMCDVVNFKMVNSVYGESTGDELLKYIGNFWLNNTGSGICARYGGDKFIGIGESVENRQKDWLLDSLEKLKAGTPVPNVTVKCGIYKDVDKSLSISAMCDKTLFAVKSVKQNYSLPYAVYSGPISQRHLVAKTFESLFDSAIEKEEFVIYYQPQHDANTEKIIGAEALVRWKMDDGRFIPPGEFIPIFEENGLIARLDEYVFRKVCQSVKYWYDKGAYVVPISVNLSRASAFQPDTVEKYKAIIEEIGLDPKYVPLELTESASIDNSQILEFMHKLREMGFQIFLDDFGSGVSSLSCINSLPFDEIKLDKSIIDCIGDAGGDELLRHTIELAHFKEMKIVAEGVEEREQLEFLKKLSCDSIQGYYFSKPLPYDELIEYFRKHFNN